MTTGDYYHALALLEEQEVRDMLLEHLETSSYTFFVYREIFLFLRPTGIADGITVSMNQTQNGIDVFRTLWASTRTDNGENRRSIAFIEHSDGVANGRHEWGSYREGELWSVSTATFLNNYLHGEYSYILHSGQSAGRVVTYHFENGFHVHLGPPDTKREGRIPVGISQTPGREPFMEYRVPDGEGFTEPARMWNNSPHFLDWFHNPQVRRYK